MIDGELLAVGEVWITVPSMSTEIHVRGSNPTVWPVEVEFSLPGEEAALLCGR